MKLSRSLLRLGLVVLLLVAARVTSLSLTRTRPVPESRPAQENEDIGHVLFADTEGWYRITDYETALVSRYDLRIDTLPGALPMELGPWRAESLPLDPAVDQWFDHPDVALQRAYTNDQGDLVWLSLFGSRGPKSFRLFEHTPATCYPLAGWSMQREDLDAIPIGNGQMHVQRGLAQNGLHKLVVLYWYLWDNPERDPSNGVLSVRISAPIRSSEDATLRMLKEEFLPYLFIDTIPWRRF